MGNRPKQSLKRSENDAESLKTFSIMDKAEISKSAKF